MNQDRYDQEEFNEFIEELFNIYKIQKQMQQNIQFTDYTKVPIDGILNSKGIVKKHKPISDEEIFELAKKMNLRIDKLKEVFKIKKRPSA